MKIFTGTCEFLNFCIQSKIALSSSITMNKKTDYEKKSDVLYERV